MTRNNYFESVTNWPAAAALVDFKPRRPKYTAGSELKSLAVHVMDHRKRQLSVNERSLEAHYTHFVIDQKRVSSEEEAKRQALTTLYGQAPARICVAGHEARSYALGPERDADDLDARSPAIIVWQDRDMIYLVASTQLDVEALYRIASSIYD
jgi:hypothetical protein